jgi:hypothetical protein
MNYPGLSIIQRGKGDRVDAPHELPWPLGQGQGIQLKPGSKLIKFGIERFLFGLKPIRLRAAAPPA